MKTTRLTRSYRRSKQRLLRAGRRQLRLASAWQQRQYSLGRAWRDLRAAITRNEDIFLGCAIGGVSLGYAFAVAASQLVFFSFQSLNALSDLTGIGMGTLAVIGLGVLATLAAWFLVLIMNALDIAVLDGAFRKAKTSLRRTARQALAETPRVSLAWLLTLAIGGSGLVIASLPLLAYVAAHRHARLDGGFIIAAAVLILAALYELSGFLLAPQAALYEPKLQLRSAAARSYHLLKPRGRLFATALTLLLGAALLGAWELSTWLQQALHYSGDIVFYLLAVLELVVANLLLSMLYRKRRLARPAAKQPSRLSWRRLSPGAPVNP